MTITQLQVPGPGYNLAADWYAGESTDHILVVLPGYTSTKEKQTQLITEVNKRAGTSTLVFDRSGHGASPLDLDETRPAQHVLETVCVFDWLTEQHPHARISVMGSSYGSFMGANLAKHRDFQTLILRAPAIYLPQDFYRPQKLIHRQGATQEFRRNTEALQKHPVLLPGRTFTGKTFVLIHELDEVIPRPTSEAYVQAFNAESYIALGFAHIFNVDAPQAAKDAYYDTLATWLKS